jgi:hypothetical protein
MKGIAKGAVIGGAGALLLGASLALSSATVVSGALRAHPDNSPLRSSSITCKKNGNAYCFTVTNNGTGNAIEGHAQNSGLGVHDLSSAQASGVYGEATTGNGLFGQSSSGPGVYGYSAYSYGVIGQSKSSLGVYGLATTSDGVYGQSTSGDGVYGTSTASSYGSGVYGRSPNYGVYGNSPSYGTGVFGQSSSGVAVGGYSAASVSGFFTNAGRGMAALIAESDDVGGYPFEAMNAYNSDSYFYVDPNGDGFFSGSVTATAYNTAQRVRNGAQVGAFNPESTQATMEDTGTSRLLNGECAVRFDPAFASTIDTSRGYQVFLTPNGDTRGLYVFAKYEGGFIVRENEHGRSSVYFDYRVVAHPYGASDARLPRLNIKPPKVPKLRPINHRHP